jgi:xylan 1,4-beta-xylosidase
MIAHMELSLVVLLALPAVMAMSYPDCVDGPDLLTSNQVCDTTASPPERATAIVAAMNITEKLSNLIEYAKCF